MKKEKNKIKIGKVISFVLASMVVAALVFFIFDFSSDAMDKINDYISTEEEMNNFGVGAISENGAPIGSKNSFYTKNHIACNGLKVDLDDNSNLKFYITFYDYEKKMINQTEVMNKDFNDFIDYKCFYARITFITDVDYQLQSIDILGYLPKFKISVSDVQGKDRLSELENNYELVGYGCFDENGNFIENGDGLSNRVYYYSKEYLLNNFNGMIIRITKVNYELIKRTEGYIFFYSETNRYEVINLGRQGLKKIFVDDDEHFVYFYYEPIYFEGLGEKFRIGSKNEKLASEIEVYFLGEKL